VKHFYNARNAIPNM
jgi:hypothetical protein